MGKGGFNLPDYVANTIYRLLGRMTKMGWLDEQTNRDLPDQIKKYFVQVRILFCFQLTSTSHKTRTYASLDYKYYAVSSKK
jgi:hypothetical protein